MDKLKFFLLAALFCLSGYCAGAQQSVSEGSGLPKAAEPNKEFFDTIVNKSNCWAVVDSLSEAGWTHIQVATDGENRKITAWRYVPSKFVVGADPKSAKVEDKEREDGTRTVKYKLSEPENGYASFTMDKEGNILSFEVYITDGE